MSVWLLVLGCTPLASPAEDARVFAEVLAHPKAPGAMQACEAILDTNTQGECQLKVALNQENQGAACEGVRTELYQHECFFMASEAARRRGEKDQAVVLCRGAGSFKEDCQQHIWQGDIRVVMGRRASFPARYAEGKKVFCSWSEEMNESPGYEDRFWELAWNTALAQTPTLDVSLCGELNPSQKERCEKSGAQLLASRLDEVMVHQDARETLCAGALPEISVLQFQTHPALDAVVARHRSAVCVQGLDRPENRGDLEINPDPDLLEEERCE